MQFETVGFSFQFTGFLPLSLTPEARYPKPRLRVTTSGREVHPGAACGQRARHGLNSHPFRVIILSGGRALCAVRELLSNTLSKEWVI